MSTTSIATQPAWGTALLRMTVGLIFAVHGAQKLFAIGPDAIANYFGSIRIPFPVLSAYVVIAVELAGGIAMIAGLGTRVVGALFAAVMLVAIATVHWAHGFFLPEGYEFNLLLLAASVALMLLGAGAFALDNVVAERRLTFQGPRTPRTSRTE